jgi:hypothetical protein
MTETISETHGSSRSVNKLIYTYRNVCQKTSFHSCHLSRERQRETERDRERQKETERDRETEI